VSCNDLTGRRGDGFSFVLFGGRLVAKFSVYDLKELIEIVRSGNEIAVGLLLSIASSILCSKLCLLLDR